MKNYSFNLFLTYRVALHIFDIFFFLSPGEKFYQFSTIYSYIEIINFKM